MATNLDLQDPSVQQLILGPREERVVMSGSQTTKVMSQVAGDEEHGFASTQYLDRGKHEVGVLFRPKNSVTMVAAVLTVDVYAIPGEPIKVHLYCPKCRHLLTVNADRKALDWQPRELNPVGAAIRAVLPPESQYLSGNLGILSVSEFRCTWELEDERDTNRDASVITGGSLCRFKGVIERNMLREV
jgi:hypothetical protein